MNGYDDDDCNRCCSIFMGLDGLVVDHIASFLNWQSIYSWVCAYRGLENEVLSPEWFFQQTLPSRDEFEILPLDEDSQERFYLAETFPQMRKCHFIPKFCMTNTSIGIHSLARWLDVDPNSVYVERIAMIMGRLLWLMREHAHARGISAALVGVHGRGIANVFLWDVICAARFFGFSSIPDHDQVFEFEVPVTDKFRHFLTTEECCSFIDLEGASTFETASTAMIRRHMKRFVEMLLPSELDQDDIVELITENLGFNSFEARTFPLEHDFDIDDDALFMEELLPVEVIDDAMFNHEYDHFMLKFDKAIDILRTLHSDLDNFDLRDFGICERWSQLPRARRLSQRGLLAHMEELEQLHPIGCVYTDSALRFIRVLIEGIHFGSAVEVKVQKRGLVDVTWDYGVLFSENGTSWRCLLLSDDDERVFDEDEDEGYTLSDDDDDDDEEHFE